VFGQSEENFTEIHSVTDFLLFIHRVSKSSYAMRIKGGGIYNARSLKMGKLDRRVDNDHSFSEAAGSLEHEMPPKFRGSIDEPTRRPRPWNFCIHHKT